MAHLYPLDLSLLLIISLHKQFFSLGICKRISFMPLAFLLVV